MVAKPSASSLAEDGLSLRGRGCFDEGGADMNCCASTKFGFNWIDFDAWANASLKLQFVKNELFAFW